MLFSNDPSYQTLLGQAIQRSTYKTVFVSTSLDLKTFETMTQDYAEIEKSLEFQLKSSGSQQFKYNVYKLDLQRQKFCEVPNSSSLLKMCVEVTDCFTKLKGFYQDFIHESDNADNDCKNTRKVRKRMNDFNKNLYSKPKARHMNKKGMPLKKGETDQPLDFSHFYFKTLAPMFSDILDYEDIRTLFDSYLLSWDHLMPQKTFKFLVVGMRGDFSPASAKDIRDYYRVQAMRKYLNADVDTVCTGDSKTTTTKTEVHYKGYLSKFLEHSGKYRSQSYYDAIFVDYINTRGEYARQFFGSTDNIIKKSLQKLRTLLKEDGLLFCS